MKMSRSFLGFYKKFLRKEVGGADSVAVGYGVGEDGFVYILFLVRNKIEERLGRALADSAHSRCIIFSNPYLYTKQNSRYRKVSAVLWWGRTDSNHRSETQQIYSLSPLATRELPRIRFVLEPVDGLEPPTY